MKTSPLIGRITLLLPALLAFGAALFAFQTLTQLPGPPFTADYNEVSHRRGNAPDEALRGRRVVHGRFWRDGKARVRQEIWEVDANGNRSKQRTYIIDQAHNLDYQLQPDKKVAYRSTLLSDQANSPANPPTDLAPSVDKRPIKTELGTQTIEGFSCNGYKSCYSGRCEETWWCPALQYVARMRRTYDSGAVDDMVWSNFKVGVEPDPQLFVVPSDYTMVDRKNPK